MFTLQPLKWCERLNLTGKITQEHAWEIERIIRDAIVNVYHKGIAEGRENILDELEEDRRKLMEGFAYIPKAPEDCPCGVMFAHKHDDGTLLHPIAI